MDIRQLRYFLAVVDHGSVHRAAERLFVAQPSISQSLRRLEADLGSPLFHRQGRGLVLSAAGAALVDPAREVVRGLDIARASVAAVADLLGGRLPIVAMPSQAVSPLTSLVAELCRRHPGVQVEVVAAARPDDVREVLRRGEAELGLVAISHGRKEIADLNFEPVETQRFVLVGRPGDFPTREGLLAPAALGGLRLVAGQPGTGMRRAVDVIVRESDCVIAVQIEHREALLPLVLAGVGVAVVAESWASLARSVGLEVRDLELDELLEVSLVWQPRRLSPAGEAFRLIAQAHAERTAAAPPPRHTIRSATV